VWGATDIEATDDAVAYSDPGQTEVILTGHAQPLTVRGATWAPAAAAATTRKRWAVIMALLTFAVDVVAVALGYFVAKAIHADVWDHTRTGLPALNGTIFVTVLAWPVIFAVYGLYDLQRSTHVTAELQRLFHAVAMCVLTVVLLSFFAQIDMSRSFIAALVVVCMVTTVAGRLIVRRVCQTLNRRALTSQATVVVGGNDEARAIARTLRRRRWMGYDVRGFVDISQSGRDMIDGLPVLGLVDDLAGITAMHDVGTVIVAGSAVGGGTLKLIDASVPTQVSVRVSPGLPNLGAARVVLEPIDGMALFSLRRHRFSRRQRLWKRILDVGVATGMLMVVAPVMGVIAVLVRLTSTGPILFRQRRVGVDGRAFVIYKFRTMVTGSEHQRTTLDGQNEADGLLFKMRHDPRVTRVGKFLRRSSLDELPQLFNILIGNMSLVGPRPALPEEAARYDDQWRGRLRVKPGLTGLWQVNGRHDLVFEDYIRYDLFYVENWSLTMDLYILSKTLPALLFGRGSY